MKAMGLGTPSSYAPTHGSDPPYQPGRQAGMTTVRE